jgi:hypothetical protein
MATTHLKRRVDIPVLDEALTIAVRDEDFAGGLFFGLQGS